MKIETLGSLKPSWPRSVVKKWLNIKSGGGSEELFHSNRHVQRGAVRKTERRKSCSDDRESYEYIPNDLSGWLYEVENGGDGHKRVKVEPHHPSELNGSNLNLRMFVGTWNVGGKPPHDGLSLEDWLKPPLSDTAAHAADIYVLGFQEIVPLNAGNVLGAEAKGPAAKWLSLIRQTLNGNGEDNNNDHFDDGENFDQCGNHGITGEQVFDISDDQPSTTATGGQRRCMSFGRSSRCNCKIEPEHDQTQSRINGGRRRKNQYYLAASKQMVGIFLCVWVRSDLHRLVNDLRVSSVGTGIMGYLGNKGSVSISMRLHLKTLCFVCTHLTSGEKEGDEMRRNTDAVEILKRTKFSRPYSVSVVGGRRITLSPETILEHDSIIWLGDLNYRLSSTSSTDTFQLLEKRDWETLLEKDQLGIEQRAGRVFEGWEEGRISFAPTYKYIPNSDDYAHVLQTTSNNSKEKRRTPAWCDRILWRGEGLKQLQYSRVESRFSDHRPVYANFTLRFDQSPQINQKPPLSAFANSSSPNIPALKTLSSAAVVAVSAAAACNARVHQELQAARNSYQAGSMTSLFDPGKLVGKFLPE